MQLSKKQNNNPKKYTDKETAYKKGEPFNSRTHKLSMDALIPHGKYKGKTLEYVLQNDNWYSEWMMKECLITSWGLCVPKELNKPVTESKWYITESGEHWLCIYECNESGVYSPYL